MSNARKLADVLAELHARKGYGRVQAADSLAEAWLQAAGELLAKQTRVGAIKRGVLEIVAANSMIAQELQFQKQSITAKLAELLPEETIRDFRTKVGPLK